MLYLWHKGKSNYRKCINFTNYNLFDKAKSTINEHIKSIYEEGKLKEEFTMRKFGISEFSTKPTNYYNLEMIIAIGYRVKSIRST